MSKKTFEMDDFLKDVETRGQHACIEETVYRWNGNNWTTLSDRYGEAFALEWLQENAPGAVSKSAAHSAWGTLKLHLLNRAIHQRPAEIVIPCQGAYVLVSENGEIIIEAPNQRRYCTYGLACKYEANADTHLFAAFMEEILPDEEIRKRVQEFVGYTLLPGHRFQRAAMWLGGGSNGKGVLSNVVQALHKNVAAIQLDNKSRFGLSGLLHASLIVSDELPPGKMDESRLKSLIAGEQLFVDIKGQQPTTTRVQGKLIVLGNNFPTVQDSSEGFWRRWEVIPFKTSVPAEKCDPKLADTIIAEELAGVLNWALEGLQRLLKRGGFEAKLPRAMQEIIKTAKCVANDITGWLSERVETVNGPVVTSKTRVYADYRRWCSENDFSPQSLQAFWLDIRRNRTDLSMKKIRVPGGGGTLNACSIVLRLDEDWDAAANNHLFPLAA